MKVKKGSEMKETVASEKEGEVVISAHAAKRMRQRGLSQADVAYVLRHGQKRHAADAKIYFLRDKDLPQEDRRLCDRLRGAAVILSRTQPIIITVWRNRQRGLHHIKCKPAAGWGQMTLNGSSG